MRRPTTLAKTLAASALAFFVLAAAAAPTTAHAAEDEAAELPALVLFDTIWKDFALRPQMKKEIEQHMLEWIGKAKGFRLVDRGQRDRTIMEKRIFVMGTPDEKKAVEIARQAGWRHFLHVTFKGVPRKGIQITFVLQDLERGAEGVLRKERTVRNHLKPLRNTARKLAFDIVREAAAALKAQPAPAPAP